MLQSPFFRRLFIPYLLLICAAIAAVGIFAAFRLRSTYLESRRQSLREELHLVAELIREDLRAGRMQELDGRIRQLGEEIGCRITIIAPDGTVLAENWADAAEMDNHGDRPEIVQAAIDREAFIARHSDTIHDGMLYLAGRIEPGPESAFLRLAVRLQELRGELWVLYTAMAAVALVAMGVAGAICFHFARRRTVPILELTGVAKGIATGDLQRRARLDEEKGELGALGQAVNMMADSMQDLLSQAAHDKAELLAILSSMSEGVIATDADQRIILVNESAARLFGFDASRARGRPLWHVVRLDRIIRSAGEVIETGERQLVEAGLVAGRHLEVCLCRYPAQGAIEGLVLVAHDTTQSMRYQELRKEFVANVSHELRTPLTVIKGFVETLLDGALADPVKAPEYLATIERHANQLTNLVNDLLELSRLESQQEVPQRTRVDLAVIVRKAVELLTPAAERKGQTLTVDASDAPLVTGNGDYLERAVANLIDNAIKYTAEGGRIIVSTRCDGSTVTVEVADNGIGIPKHDLARIFERFYRVDRSRSREMGGTGLGLSIVKHIVQSHGGTVEVESTPGEGSIFRFTLPALRAGAAASPGARAQPV